MYFCRHVCSSTPYNRYILDFSLRLYIITDPIYLSLPWWDKTLNGLRIKKSEPDFSSMVLAIVFISKENKNPGRSTQTASACCLRYVAGYLPYILQAEWQKTVKRFVWRLKIKWNRTTFRVLKILFLQCGFLIVNNIHNISFLSSCLRWKRSTYKIKS